MIERMLFCAHGGHVSGRPSAILMRDHCLPIAVSDHGLENGLHACWSSMDDPEEFLTTVTGGEAVEFGIRGPQGEYPGGLYIYEVEYDPDSASDSDEPDEAWAHLRGGTIRRPTPEELLPLAEGRAPWGGEVL